MPNKLTPSSLCKEVDKLISFLFSKKLLIDANISHSYSNKTKHETCVTWRNCTFSQNDNYSTLQEFLGFISSKQYSFILYDGALIHISYTISHNSICKHRLGYYPSPFPLKKGEWSEYQEFGLGLIEYFRENFQYQNLENRLILQAPIRLDFDKQSAQANHPATHLHVAKEICRIPVFGPISLGDFIRFVFKNFYPDDFDDNKSLQEWPSHDFSRTISDEHRYCFHIEKLRHVKT